MSLITHTELIELVEQGVIEGVEAKRINAASIDVTLGAVLWFESEHGYLVDLADKQAPNLCRHEIGNGYALAPGEFVLAQTHERFNLPDDIAAEFRLKSSGARSGLDQALAVWCDPGWNGSVLTLELKNNLSHHSLLLRKGMPIGQMIFWRGAAVSESASYARRGRYNGDSEAQPSRGAQ